MGIDQQKLMASIRNRIRWLRFHTPSGAVRATPMSQSQLADLIGDSRSVVANIENGRQQISILYLYEICRVLEVEIRDILPSASDVIDGFQRSALNDLSIEWAGEKHSLPPEDEDFARALEQHLQKRKEEV